MKNSILKDILDLKEGNGYHIIDISYKSYEDGRFSLVFDGDANFQFIIEDKFEELITASISLYKVYKEEIKRTLKSSNSNEFPLVSLSVIADNKGNCINMKISNFGVTKANPNDIEEIINTLNNINNNLTDNLNKLLDKFAEENDIVK